MDKIMDEESKFVLKKIFLLDNQNPGVVGRVFKILL